MALKTNYHHGELRLALIRAARTLIQDRQGNDFSLADACRGAGVSTAAPYRHFSDKNEIIAEVVALGFRDMKDRAQAETSTLEAGAPERILTLGRVYLGFALQEPALFRMMFGQRPANSRDHVAVQEGTAFFDFVLSEVISYCNIHQVRCDALEVATQLWTQVHGAASLSIGGDYAKVVPQIDISQMIEASAERLLFLLPRGPTV
jgi:AcrR family transcriptional regulator